MASHALEKLRLTRPPTKPSLNLLRNFHTFKRKKSQHQSLLKAK